MTALDWIFAPAALLCFALSLAVLPWFVPLPDLIVVCFIAVSMCAYDFWRMATRASGRNGGSDRD